MNLNKINNLKIKIYLDGADIDLAKSCENNDNIKERKDKMNERC